MTTTKQQLLRMEFLRDQVWAIVRGHSADIQSLLDRDNLTYLSAYDSKVIKLVLLAELGYEKTKMAHLSSKDFSDENTRNKSYTNRRTDS
jgi:hypothetical protein